MSNRKAVRILLVGDHGVGKTSLVSTLLKEKFVEEVEDVMPEVVIPSHVTPERVVTHIIDTSSRPERRDILESEMRKANVICVVYSVGQHTTFENITSFWLPFIRNLGVNVPVILVGNKMDLRSGPSKPLEEEVMPIMNEWKEVETCVECSALKCSNVSEVFYFAQKAVLHPTGPLYDGRTHNLKPKCTDALKRVFVLSDSDCDGILNDTELNKFQVECFNSPLQPAEVLGVKSVIAENEPEGVRDGGITERGFLFLHKLFIQKGRLETTWQVLRKFGYDNDLELRDDFLSPKFVVSASQSVELSLVGTQFFTELFAKFDKDQDRALNEEELESLFQTSPGNPWVDLEFTTVTNKLKHVTLKGFLAQWAMTTLLDHKTTLKYLAYLGFKGDTTTALQVTRKKKADSSKPTKGAKTVLNCFVFGKKGSGKTALLRRHIGLLFSNKYTTTNDPYSVVNTVEVSGTEKYLVMQEFGEGVAENVFEDKKKMTSADVLCFLYDSSDMRSFNYIAQLMTEYRQEISSLPCCIMATKRDLDMVEQKYEVQPSEFCKQLGIASPVFVSVKDAQRTVDISALLTNLALDGEHSIPYSPKKQSISPLVLWGGAALSLGVIGVAIYFGIKYFGTPAPAPISNAPVRVAPSPPSPPSPPSAPSTSTAAARGAVPRPQKA